MGEENVPEDCENNQVQGNGELGVGGGGIGRVFLFCSVPFPFLMVGPSFRAV